jgi:hypothetical protein
LADDHFGIGINVQSFGLKRESALQGFHQRDVFGDVVILMANPFGDADGAAGAAINDHANAGRARVSLGSPIDISYQFGDHSSATISKMRRERERVKMIIGFGVDFCLILVMCKILCKSSASSKAKFLTADSTTSCLFLFSQLPGSALHQLFALTFMNALLRLLSSTVERVSEIKFAGPN